MRNDINKLFHNTFVFKVEDYDDLVVVEFFTVVKGRKL